MRSACPSPSPLAPTSSPRPAVRHVEVAPRRTAPARQSVLPVSAEMCPQFSAQCPRVGNTGSAQTQIPPAAPASSFASTLPWLSRRSNGTKIAPMRKQAYSRKTCSTGQRQQAGEKISLAKAALQQNHRQGPGKPVEFRPRNRRSALRIDQRHRRRLFASPFLHRPM